MEVKDRDERGEKGLDEPPRGTKHFLHRHRKRSKESLGDTEERESDVKEGVVSQNPRG